jgi:hypothetical protein
LITEFLLLAIADVLALDRHARIDHDPAKATSAEHARLACHHVGRDRTLRPLRYIAPRRRRRPLQLSRLVARSHEWPWFGGSALPSPPALIVKFTSA